MKICLSQSVFKLRAMAPLTQVDGRHITLKEGMANNMFPKYVSPSISLNRLTHSSLHLPPRLAYAHKHQPCGSYYCIDRYYPRLCIALLASRLFGYQTTLTVHHGAQTLEAVSEFVTKTEPGYVRVAKLCTPALIQKIAKLQYNNNLNAGDSLEAPNT